MLRGGGRLLLVEREREKVKKEKKYGEDLRWGKRERKQEPQIMCKRLNHGKARKGKPERKKELEAADMTGRYSTLKEDLVAF